MSLVSLSSSLACHYHICAVFLLIYYNITVYNSISEIHDTSLSFVEEMAMVAILFGIFLSAESYALTHITFLQKTGESVSTYAAQCNKCFKWTTIPTKEEYEKIRCTFIEDPWVCDRMPGRSCDSPADIEYDSSRLWVIDKPNIPRPPAGFERILVARSDYSKFDVYYITPSGKRVRSIREVQDFIEKFPKYKDVALSDFSFTNPKVPKVAKIGTSVANGEDL